LTWSKVQGKMVSMLIFPKEKEKRRKYNLTQLFE
jgi:hypothetical protein